MLFIKNKFIQFIYREKFRAITKSELVQEKQDQKFKKHNQFYF